MNTPQDTSKDISKEEIKEILLKELGSFCLTGKTYEDMIAIIENDLTIILVRHLLYQTKAQDVRADIQAMLGLMMCGYIAGVNRFAK